MKDFPKKYNIQELHNRSKKYKETHQNNNEQELAFSQGNIPVHKKLSYKDFFYHYVRDFFNYINDKKHKDLQYQQLFIASSNQLENICSGYKFFDKKNQTLNQVGINKFKRRITSTSKKNLNANNKIIESYLSSPHKLFIPDSNLYLYILDKFQLLWEKGKITCDKKIGYRSFKLKTSIAPQHITRKEEKRPFYVLKYFVGAKCEALPVCLDDVDLCCGDVALLVHPKDKRYNKYIGKTAIIPLCNRQIPIIGDDNVNIALNNGIQRVCPCSDQESIEIAQKYGLPTNIFVFNKDGLYTNYIHEHAFIGQERSKYYNNIEGFIKDIGNLEKKGEKTVQVPYLDYINERLIPYKIDQITLNLAEEKQTILNKIFNHELNFSFLDSDFGEILNKIDYIQKELEENTGNGIEDDNTNNLQNNLQSKISELKQEIIDKIDKYLPDFLICNSQLQYGWRIPIIENSDGNISFFDIEKENINEEDLMQFCFNYIILSLVRIGILGIYGNKDNKIKLCEHKNFIRILSENEKKIGYFINNLSKASGEKPEYKRFSQIIENLSNENNSSINDCLKILKESKLIQEDGNWLILNLTGISNDTIDYDFLQSCIPCYLQDKNIKMDNQIIFKQDEKYKIFKELLIQELLLGQTIPHNFLEFSYDETNEFLGDRQLTKLQLEQSQRDLFKLYGENPIRLNFLIDKTYDQKEILLNNIFLKQIRNAIRLCIKKDFLPKDIGKTLTQQPTDLEDLDLGVLYNLNSLYNDRKNVETYEEYSKFFTKFKRSIQDLFFSRYLEIQKIKPSNNVQFICSYFFNFLLSVLYPLTPEFVEALQYVSEKDFLFPVNTTELNKSIDYNIHLIYDTFLRIKNIKIECNIKQHEYCNIFIKSNPTICELFTQYEQIFINYFHISDIIYLRLHEQSPLGYETFSNDTLTIGIQSCNSTDIQEKESLESIEKEIKNLDDKLNLLRQRLPFLEGESRTKAEEEYSQTKEEIENLTIKYSLLNSK